jgi:hypothetical protein
VRLVRPQLPKINRSVSEIAAAYEPLVCEIRSSFGHGSGILISEDGIILTCGHVLLGADQMAVFHVGHHAGTYELEILFVNELQEVAVGRARDLHAEICAPVRLQTEAAKGEEVVAFGNPALIDSTTGRGGVSHGVVSNPLVKMKTNQERLAGDITVAQSSCGGPLISLVTGEVIGVITHIVEASKHPGPEGSTSGVSCLSAPSSKLSEWLGLAYLTPPDDTKKDTEPELAGDVVLKGTDEVGSE